MLTQAQIDDFWEVGFLVIDDVFDANDVASLRTACDTPSVAEGLELAGHRERVVHLLELTTRHSAFRELAGDPRLVDRVAQLIGSDIQVQHSKLTTKPPVVGRGAFDWHQDFAFFPHTNSDLVAVMVMLDDATPENGCMSTVRGSHKLGLLSHSADGQFKGACQDESRWLDTSRHATLTPRAGGISIHHCMSLHASPENLSGRPRRGIVYQYRAADAFQLGGHLFLDTGYQVSGSPSTGVRCDPATHELPVWEGTAPARGPAWGQCGDLASRWNRERLAVSP